MEFENNNPTHKRRFCKMEESCIRNPLREDEVDVKQMLKQLEIESMKEHIISKLYREGGDHYERPTSPILNISIYDAYEYYCSYYANMHEKQNVNKSYFEKYIFENVSEYITDSNFINSDWVISG